jgi:hypothetical protein
VRVWSSSETLEVSLESSLLESCCSCSEFARGRTSFMQLASGVELPEVALKGVWPMFLVGSTSWKHSLRESKRSCSMWRHSSKSSKMRLKYMY